MAACPSSFENTFYAATDSSSIPNPKIDGGKMADIDSLILRLKENILKVNEDPTSARLDNELFNECRAVLPQALAENPPVLKEIISLISGLLQKLEQDPAPVTQLLLKLVEPLAFSDVLQLEPPVDFVAGLQLSAVPYHELALSLISKATKAAQDAAILAGLPTIVYSLVKLWLCAPDTAVAEKVGSIIAGLLRIDIEDVEVQAHGFGDKNTRSGGQGLMWRRIFSDKDVYGLLYSVPSLSSNGDDSISKGQKSIAQARLMTFLVRIGQLDWNYITKSHHPEIEAAFGLKSDQGLLQFVSIHAVDYKNDVLIHLNLLQFFADLISQCRRPSPRNRLSSASLEFLRNHELHQHAMSYWLHADDPSMDPLDMSFLYGASANYVATYSQAYPNDFLAGSEAHLVLLRLMKTLDLSANQWAHGQSPKHDLAVLSSVPRVALLPQKQFGTGRNSSPLLLVPCKVTNEDVLNSLSQIFISRLVAGKNDSSSSTTENTAERVLEAQAARALLHAYLQFHESLFSDLVNHANTMALPDKALAAINVLTSIAGSRYPPLPENSEFDGTEPPKSVKSLPSENQLESREYPFSASQAYFQSHVPMIIQSPIRGAVFSWLLKPAQSFGHLVGGLGDTESAAYLIASAKRDLLQVVHRTLQAQQSPSAGDERPEQVMALRAVESRLREGIFGNDQEVGGRVATLEL